MIMIMIKNQIKKIKFDSDDELRINKTIEIPTIVVRAIFFENNKYPQVSLDECLYKI